MRPRNELALLPKVPVLITESADEFDALRDAFEREIKPRGIIEQMYVHDICSIVWEILRLRRCKVVILRLPGVDRSFPDPSTFPNPSTPQRRCRHKSLTDRRKPSDGCCQNRVSWTDTSAALPRAETERLSLLGQQLRVASRQTKPIFVH